ncbi:LTA synthase family protein [Halomonas sp. BM-2019]|uniref:LTA synthase family protein n=1 Tax=Halomonas sp. BM-2019 TaxID=2811227 RepID=UPI001B3C24DE|nr:MAG: LTA synthase family protein [Halomonas sp. BM-2019]
MTITILAPLLCGLVLTFVIEALLRPPVAPFWRRPPSTLAVHLGSECLLFALFLLLLQRPWFAVAFIASLQLVVVQASNTKSATLKEPFICQDFEYFLDAVKHPRLYVPFFGIGLAVAASSAGALAIAGFLWLEPSLLSRQGPAALLPPAGLLLIAAALLLPGLKHLPPCRLAPQADLHRLGLFAALWAYGRLALRALPEASRVTAFATPATPPPAPERLPHLVVVQSESFFDPREWHAGLADAPIAGGLLPHFDALRRDALMQGPLQVPAWGANTVRTEAAVLTGLTPEALGIHRFTPYRQFTRGPVASLASRLRGLGYRTVCLHPYPASFYLRHQVMPQLGFDDFLDSRHFRDADRDGQYISDAAVTKKVGTLLDDSDNKPLFVFAITMENHGPLHLERPVPEDSPRLPEATARHLEAADLADLRVYLRHLRNADAMLGRLRERLTPSSPEARPGMLCWYGDHVPILSGVFRRLGEPSGDTCYALWSSRPGVPGAPAMAKPLAASALGMTTLEALLREAGLPQAGQDAAMGDHNDAVGQIQSHQEQE